MTLPYASALAHPHGRVCVCAHVLAVAIAIGGSSGSCGSGGGGCSGVGGGGSRRNGGGGSNTECTLAGRSHRASSTHSTSQQHAGITYPHEAARAVNGRSPVQAAEHSQDGPEPELEAQAAALRRELQEAAYGR
eukprot:4739091-Pleurochrysis_carterae.AAC.1